MMKKSVWSVLFFLLLSISAASRVPAFAEEMSSATLKEISEKQDRILQALEEIKSEVNIVKIRVTSGG